MIAQNALDIASKAIISHTFGVQGRGLRFRTHTSSGLFLHRAEILADTESHRDIVDEGNLFSGYKPPVLKTSNYLGGSWALTK